MVYTELAPRRLQFHVGTSPCQRCKYTTSVDIKKCAIKLVTHVESHASAVSLVKRARKRYISDHQSINPKHRRQNNTTKHHSQKQISSLDFMFHRLNCCLRAVLSLEHTPKISMLCFVKLSKLSSPHKWLASRKI